MDRIDEYIHFLFFLTLAAAPFILLSVMMASAAARSLLRALNLRMTCMDPITRIPNHHHHQITIMEIDSVTI